VDDLIVARRRARLGAVQAKSLVDVLEEIRERHPDAELKEFESAGMPRGTWTVEDLLSVVRRDLQAMTPQQRADFDRYRYFWGYGPSGQVEVVHAPVRGIPFAQFIQIEGS
jgi:hypothetical protein